GNAEDRRADAADEFARYHPFASVVDDPNGNDDAYAKAINSRGTLEFGSIMSLAATYAGGLKWSYPPSAEQRALVFVDYVCSKMLRNRVSFSGNPGENGKPRVFGLV